MSDDDAYCLIVQPQPDDPDYYEARWVSYDPGRLDGRLCGGVGEVFLDLMPFMIAREMLNKYYDPLRTLVVKLYGSDRVMVHAPLGAVAATPIVNFGAPVNRPTHLLYRGSTPIKGLNKPSFISAPRSHHHGHIRSHHHGKKKIGSWRKVRRFARRFGLNGS